MPRQNWQRLCFPDNPRDFLGRRMARSILRTIHILGGGVLVGAYVFQQPAELIQPWFLMAVISGLLLLATDLYASLAIVFEWRGLSIATKITLLLLLPQFPGLELLILILILSIGSISSHLSRKFRHRLWWQFEGLKTDERHG